MQTRSIKIKGTVIRVLISIKPGLFIIAYWLSCSNSSFSTWMYSRDKVWNNKDMICSFPIILFRVGVSNILVVATRHQNTTRCNFNICLSWVNTDPRSARWGAYWSWRHIICPNINIVAVRDWSRNSPGIGWERNFRAVILISRWRRFFLYCNKKQKVNEIAVSCVLRSNFISSTWLFQKRRGFINVLRTKSWKLKLHLILIWD